MVHEIVVSLQQKKETNMLNDKTMTTMKTMTASTKRLILAMVMMLATAMTANAMSYEQARNEALFLTDKMAYELNLTDAQYEAAYEINLDYLMGVASRDDVFGIYWERRNLDLSYILYSWQWEAFRAASYFYRPLYWDAGYWHFGVYARYPRRDYFYFGRPHFYATYRGGHSWHLNGGHSYYHGRAEHFRPALSQNRSHYGMRDGFNHGDFRNNRGAHNGSSTRITSRPTENSHRFGDNRPGDRSYGNSGSGIRSNPGSGSGVRSNPSSGSDVRSNPGSGSDVRSNPSSGMRSNSGNVTPSRNFGNSSGSMRSNPSSGMRSNSGNATPSRNFGNSGSGMRSSGSAAPSRSAGNSGGMRSGGSGQRSNGGGHFGGGRR